MSSLGHSSVHAPSNQILQPIISGGANPPNAHFTNAYGSIVGGITGCGGAGGSAAALAGNHGYNIVSTQSGGNIGAHRQHRRGGYKRSHKRCKCHGKCHCRVSKHCKCRGKCHCKGQSKKRRGQSKKRRGQSKRRHRGGMASFSPASFSGPNPPYHQYGSNIPNSPVFSLGGALSPALSGLASPPPIDSVVNRCS